MYSKFQSFYKNEWQIRMKKCLRPMLIDLWIVEGLIRMKNLVSLIMHNYQNIHVSPVTKQRVALTRSHPNQKSYDK